MRNTLFVLAWPLLWFVTPLSLRVRVILKNKQGEVLLVKHSFGADQWMLPGGGVKYGESVVDTASRETQEELAINIAKNTITIRNNEALIWKTRGLTFRVIIVQCTLSQDQIDKITPSYEIREYKWYDSESNQVHRALPREIPL